MPNRPRRANPEIDGPKLREMRQLMGLTVTEVAAKVGITQGYLSGIELETRLGVSPAVFVRICDAMGVTDRAQLLRRDRDLVKDAA